MSTKSNSKALALRFSALFAGFSGAHGTYEIKRKEDRGKMKGQAITHKRGAKLDDYEAHLTGKSVGLGIIPLLDDNTVKFAALDIDINNIDHAKLEASIKARNYPLIVCRSKSGGAHLYVFLAKPVDASIIRDRLADWAADLGYGGCEIFPKQSARASDIDYGNWINLPFYKALTGDLGRAAMINGKWVDLETFMAFAEEHTAKFDKVKYRELPKPDNGDPLFEAPPCLQYLFEAGGFPSGTRNDGMFNVAVYLKKRYADDWERKLSEYNSKFCSPVLDSREINDIIKSVKRKEYHYKCSQAPINAHCNRRECIMREYGVGETREGVLEIGAVTRYVTNPGDPVMWGLEVAGRRVFVDNETLYSRDNFNRHCMGELSRIPVQIAPARWLKMLDELASSADTIQLPPDAGPTGLLIDHVEAFCLQKAQAKSLDEVWTGRPYREAGKVYFRSLDLFTYLDTRRVDYGKNKQNVFHILKSRGGETHVKSVGGKAMNLWQYPEPSAPVQSRTDTAKKKDKEDF